MNDTPRTNKALDSEVGTPDSMAVLHLCRQLERENAKLREALIECRNASDDTEIHAMIDALIF